ncbi:MAG TPA: DUF2845 domain-containing protein [Candidatus Saccharimonadia bacterium]|nr:DUF2845 domain-containing protein [Candidatus Saccharimonadia bacterium]
MNTLSMRAAQAVIALACAAAAGDALALRCNGRIVSIGDHRFEGEERCGEPYWVERYSEYQVIGEFAPVQRTVEHRIEAWYYNFGTSSLMRRLVFIDNRLYREDTLGYGYAALGTDCNLDALVPGISTGEVVARCGTPAADDTRYVEQVVRDGAGNARERIIRQDEWMYRKSSRAPRLLTFSDGRLASIERLRK